MISLGERMKTYYEMPYKVILPMRMPVIIRLDGKAFHTYTDRMEKPFDQTLQMCFESAVLSLFTEIQGLVLAYMQSDEVSLLLHNYKRLESQAWFGNNLQKLVSVSSSMLTARFNMQMRDIENYTRKFAYFDARAFVLPENEVCNYFIWRQQDCIRNSISSVANHFFPPKQLHKKDRWDQLALLESIGIDWDNYSHTSKYGTTISAMYSTINTPIFTENRDFVERHLIVDDE